MPLTDWAARWRPVESYQPCRVWIPTQPQPVPALPPDDPAPSPREVRLVLTAAEADDVPRHLARLVGQATPGRGGHVTVELGTATRVHLTGLHLLLTVLWRRVGPHGSVDLSGGSPSLRAQLASLGLLPQHVRRDVFGSAPAAPAQRQEPGTRPVLIPQQRQADPARLVLSGELDIANAARNRARLDELLATGVREVEVDLSEVTFMDLATLRILLQADAQLRPRGGRLRLLHPSRLVRRLLAVTATEHLTAHETTPDPGSSAAGRWGQSGTARPRASRPLEVKDGRTAAVVAG